MHQDIFPFRHPILAIWSSSPHSHDVSRWNSFDGGRDLEVEFLFVGATKDEPEATIFLAVLLGSSYELHDSLRLR